MRLRDRLKAETASAHEQLEAQLDLTGESFARDDLLRLLERFLGYYKTCEDQIALAPPDLAVLLAARRKVPLLINDLNRLGRDDQSIAALPLCPLSPATTIPTVLGRWYVLEGSTLGGQYVARHLIHRLSLDPAACSFFRSYGDEVGARWREFCELLNAHASPEHHDEAIQTARDTFNSLSHWLTHQTA